MAADHQHSSRRDSISGRARRMMGDHFCKLVQLHGRWDCLTCQFQCRSTCSTCSSCCSSQRAAFNSRHSRVCMASCRRCHLDCSNSISNSIRSRCSSRIRGIQRKNCCSASRRGRAIPSATSTRRQGIARCARCIPRLQKNESSPDIIISRTAWCNHQGKSPRNFKHECFSYATLRASAHPESSHQLICCATVWGSVQVRSSGGVWSAAERGWAPDTSWGACLQLLRQEGRLQIRSLLQVQPSTAAALVPQWLVALRRPVGLDV